jgi:hypothetical protein
MGCRATAIRWFARSNPCQHSRFDSMSTARATALRSWSGPTTVPTQRTFSLVLVRPPPLEAVPALLQSLLRFESVLVAHV